jgi:hypothetical protein
MRIAVQLTPELIAGATSMVGVEDQEIFGDRTYAIVESLGHFEFNFKLVSEDEIFEAAKTDSDLQIISL